MRTRKAILNSITSLALQLTSLLSGFILTRLFLAAFGSAVNGAVSSITQFLGYISLLEAGVGGVTRAALYKPLAEKNKEKISEIINATQDFFKKIAYIFVLYALVLSCTFHYISSSTFDWIFTATLVLILSASTFAQYYFGLAYSILIQADQRYYIVNCINIATTLLNVILSVFLLKLGCSIHLVKLCSTAVYVLRPVALNQIAKKYYHINTKAMPDKNAINQRWNGLGHHLAFYIHNNVDVMVVTVILGLKWSSVYAVYYMILNGVKNIVNAITGGGEAAFGNMIARHEQQILRNRFELLETLTSITSIIFFTVSGLLLFDFIRIYTSGISDIEYIVVPAGILFCISEALHCFKQPLNSIILAAGHYKQTQTGAFIEAGLNLGLSVAFAFLFGLSGILLATIIATLYRILYFARYLKKNILYRPYWPLFKRLLINILAAAVAVILFRLLPFSTSSNYIQWVLKAVAATFVVTVTVLFINCFFYRDNLYDIVHKVIHSLKLN